MGAGADSNAFDHCGAGECHGAMTRLRLHGCDLTAAIAANLLLAPSLGRTSARLTLRYIEEVRLAQDNSTPRATLAAG